MKKYIASFVYGATDGVVTTFAVIGGVYGAQLSPVIVLILGISNVAADGFSMAASNYLSKRSEGSASPMKSSLATFSAFIGVGMIPLLPFIYALFFDLDAAGQFAWSIAATFFAFVMTGVVRGRVMGKNALGTVAETVLVGGLAAAIAYIAGVLLKGLA